MAWVLNSESTARLRVHGDDVLGRLAGTGPRRWGEGATWSRGSFEEALDELERLGSAWTVDVDVVQGALDPYRRALEEELGCARTKSYRIGHGYGRLVYETISFGPDGQLAVDVVYRVDVYRAYQESGASRYREQRYVKSRGGPWFAWCGFVVEDRWVFRALLPWDDAVMGQEDRRALVERMRESFRLGSSE